MDKLIVVLDLDDAEGETVDCFRDKARVEVYREPREYRAARRRERRAA